MMSPVLGTGAPEAADALGGADRVDDGLRVGRPAHRGGGDEVVAGGYVVGDERGQGAVVRDRVARDQLAGGDGGEDRPAGEARASLTPSSIRRASRPAARKLSSISGRRRGRGWPASASR